MSPYAIFLHVMCGLFVLSAAVLLAMAAGQTARRRYDRAAAYLGLTLLAGVVAAGFYYFSQLTF